MQREIGKTGIKVYPIGLGAMPLSIYGRPSQEDAIKVIHKAIELGINFIDTANVYCLDDNDIGHNERLITKALKIIGAEKSVTVATKGGLTRPQGRWEQDGRPASLRRACEQSLKDLGVDVITLYQYHAPDYKVRFEDSIQELANLKKEGKVLHIGLSNVELNQLITALKITRIESVQNFCNPFYKKDFINGLINFCADNKVTYIPYSPVGGHKGQGIVKQYNIFLNLAEKYNSTPYNVILAWFLAKNQCIIPIPGASKISSITDSSNSANLKLEKDDIERIDKENFKIKI